MADIPTDEEVDRVLDFIFEIKKKKQNPFEKQQEQDSGKPNIHNIDWFRANFPGRYRYDMAVYDDCSFDRKNEETLNAEELTLQLNLLNDFVTRLVMQWLFMVARCRIEGTQQNEVKRSYEVLKAYMEVVK